MVKMQNMNTLTAQKINRKLKRTYIDLRKIAKLKNNIISHSRRWRDKIWPILFH